MPASNGASVKRKRSPSDWAGELQSKPFGERAMYTIDLTQYLCLPQHQAAKSLGIPSSTLSKKWCEATKDRKWPYRKVAKLNNEIKAILQKRNEEVTDLTKQELEILIKKRQLALAPVSIQMPIVLKL